jgi:hypothetical protein
VLVGCYAYSAYSHPPSFKLHPNVYLQTTTAYRRTPLSLEQQLEVFGKRTRQMGIREYYSVYQWDWDFPDAEKVQPSQLQRELRLFHRHGVTAINAEASNNWAPRGLGYWIAGRLMWDVDADVKSLTRDFLNQAFGPAAAAMQQYYARFYGSDLDVLAGDGALPAKVRLVEKDKIQIEVLKAAFDDLDRAAKLAGPRGKYRDRVDQMRMYLHYLVLRYRLELADQAGSRAAILLAIEAETRFAGRLADTHLIHSRAIIGKAFPRRFRKYAELLRNAPDDEKWAKPWRVLGEPPSSKELERLWAEDRKLLSTKPPG